MADKDFRVKNKLHVNGLNNASGVILATNNALDSHTTLPTQYGGTGTTTSPNAGQILYSSSGTNYTPTTLSSLDVKGATYSADAPASPFVGQVWIESDSSSDSFDPNIMRRKTITATAGQTTFTTDLAFIQGYEQVYFNGMLLLRTTDYTTPTTTTVELVAAAAGGDIVEILSITNLNSVNTYTQSEINSTFAPLSNPTFTAIGGSEGGQINLAAAPSNTTLSGNINLDVYQNRVRLFEGGGNNRGAYVDLSTLSNGVGSELIAAAPQSGNSGKYLTTNGTSASWTTLPIFSGIYATGTSPQTISNTTETVVTFDAEVYDTDGYHSTSSNTGRITIPSGKSGYYSVNLMVVWQQNATGGHRTVYLKKNGNQYLHGGASNTPNSTVSNAVSIPMIVNLSAGDYIEVAVYQNSGGNLNVEKNTTYPASYFIAQYLGA